MKLLSALFVFLCLFPATLLSQAFSCPTGQADMVKYFGLIAKLFPSEGRLRANSHEQNG